VVAWWYAAEVHVKCCLAAVVAWWYAAEVHTVCLLAAVVAWWYGVEVDAKCFLAAVVAWWYGTEVDAKVYATQMSPRVVDTQFGKLRGVLIALRGSWSTSDPGTLKYRDQNSSFDLKSRRLCQVSRSDIWSRLSSGDQNFWSSSRRFGLV